VATTHCLAWNHITPVFADIDPARYTLDPDAVEAAITPRTEAILAVHVFGTPCHLERLEAIARKHGIALIYDAAHAFGLRVNGRSIAGYGDCSMFSFHATKLYHSIEGGALTFRDPALKKRFDYLKNFGFENETEVVMPGTNAKMNEMQALMGELVLRDMDAIIAKRKVLAARYMDGLAGIPGIRVAAGVTGAADVAAAITPNYAYLPVEVVAGEYPLSRDALYERLKTYNVFARRYFYPLITDFACYRGCAVDGQLPVAAKVARQIMTLPIYHDLDPDDVDKICQILRAESGG
jgi:dTDP-4-amino-4,6-dideoxygalactose transaminase